jgi:hypothetical protein
MIHEKGFKHSEETKQKISNSLKGEKHFAWKADNAGYQSIRTWIRKNFPKPDKCKNPFCNKKCFNFQWVLRKGKKLSRNKEDYICLCNSCKRKIFFKEETRQKISKARKGKHLSAEHKNILRERMKKFNPNFGGLSKEHKKKIKQNHSRHMLGKHLSESTKDALRLANLGEKSNFWQGGKSFEPYDKSFNNKFKRAIRKRDNQICMLCGIHREKLNRALDIHHVDYNKLLSIPQNCISLCRHCHTFTNHHRVYWTRLFREKLSKLYGYKYEKGLIIYKLYNQDKFPQVINKIF